MCWGAPAWAEPGALDPSFSADGWTRTLEVGGILPEGAEDVAIQENGRIVVVGTALGGEYQDYGFGVVRYTTSGDLDTTFGAGGGVWIGEEDGAVFPFAVALQSDGKIVVAGEGECALRVCFTVVRLTTGGALDPTFSGDGVATGPFRGAAFDVAVQPDGRIVAVGYHKRYGDAQNVDRFAVARYGPNGSLDATFSGDGKRTFDFGWGNESAEAVAIRSDGRIVVAGTTTMDATGLRPDFGIVRVNRDGSPDGSFSGDGRREVDFSDSSDFASGLALTGSGQIVVAGTSAGKVAVARLRSGGGMDGAFGRRGRLRTLVGTHASGANDVVVDSEGRVLVGGVKVVHPREDDTDWLLIRYLRTGERDSAFGAGGIVATNFGTGRDSVRGLALQDDGKIVAAGPIYQSFGVARYLAS